MSQAYTCPNCKHIGRLIDAHASTRDDARVACPRCGALIDTLAIKAAEDKTECETPSTPSAERIKDICDQTIDWKSHSALPLIPGYELIREIGRGGMGVVYRARCVRLNRAVALKMILSGPFSSSDQLGRFRTETQAVAQLQHANIVQIYEVGEFEGRPYCAFEYVDGGSLADKIFHNPQPSRDSAEMVDKLALAIHTAHQRGIVHRDLKPDNILLTADGAPKISDFGLAKRLEAETGQTQTGSILGTPGYMAPEQAAGKTREVGPAADVWALGAILYHLLTGQPPFKAPPCSIRSNRSARGNRSLRAGCGRNYRATWRSFVSSAWIKIRTGATPAPRPWPTTSAASFTTSRSTPARPAGGSAPSGGSNDIRRRPRCSASCS